MKPLLKICVTVAVIIRIRICGQRQDSKVLCESRPPARHRRITGSTIFDTTLEFAPSGHVHREQFVRPSCHGPPGREPTLFSTCCRTSPPERSLKPFGHSGGESARTAERSVPPLD